MVPGDIARATGDGFSAIGGFLGATGIVPTGAQLAVYRDWDGTKMTIDIGFPVGPADTVWTTGEVTLAFTPAGRAMSRYSGDVACASTGPRTPPNSPAS